VSQTVPHQAPPTTQSAAAAAPQTADIAVIGAGAAGLFAAIWAGRTAQRLCPGTPTTIVALDGAKKLGAKVLVAGGGRCNVTHHAVDERSYFGSSRNAIKKVLRAFDVARTTEFFAQLGVTLKREETGKLFPTTDDAHTVLDALITAANDANVQLRHPWRVGCVCRNPATGHFQITRAASDQPNLAPLPSGEPSPDQPIPPLAPEVLVARRVILATGGMALPRSGSDGLGYTFARALGHTLTPRLAPALVPLVLPPHFLRELSGLALPARFEVRSSTGKRLEQITGPALCTHFGLSGPAPMDISRVYFDTLAHDPGATLVACWAPDFDVEPLDQHLQARRDATPLRALTAPPISLPDRFARALLASINLDPHAPMTNLPRDQRRELARALCAMTIPALAPRGFTYAEVTAGGVPLDQIHLATMASRLCPGLHLCGEICDVDGRIGGFNFQWAWASGYLAGTAAASSELPRGAASG
jgi:hypothetical protein